MLVSGSYFRVLGLQPALGRLFTPNDDRTPGGHPLVVLSYDYWQTRFNRSPAVLNDTLIVNGRALTIIGVAPSGFVGTTLGRWPQVFVPITMRELMVPGSTDLTNRRRYWVYLFARLKPGVSREHPEAAINVPYRRLISDIEAPLQTEISEQTLARFRAKTVKLEDGASGQSKLHQVMRAPLLLLLGVTGFVLLIACANIANLLLVRGAGRASEMGVRLSVGASRRHLVTQLLTESCVLGALGGVSGIVVAYWTVRLMGWLVPSGDRAALLFDVDPSVMLFAGALSLGTALVFGLFPALHSTRPDLLSTLKGQAGQPSGSRGTARFRTSLATAQIALSMALLISAGLFVKSLVNINHVDLGFHTEQLVMFRVSPELNGYTNVQSRALFGRIEEELAAVPGVQDVSSSTVALLSGRHFNNDVSVEGFRAGPDTDTDAGFNLAGPSFFRTLGVPLVAGRDFTGADVQGAPKVAIINEAFARKFNLGRNALAKRLSTSTEPSEKLDLEIVGLVRDAKYSQVKEATPPQLVLPYRQYDGVGSMTFYVRPSVAPGQLLGTIPAVLRRIDANLPVERLRTMDAQVEGNVFIDRIIATLSAAFAALATLLAAVGLYGVLAYTVAQRTREIGLRMALGADAMKVRVMVLSQVERMTLVGGVSGILAALGLGYVGRSLLFGLQAHDPAVLVGAATILTVVSLGAGFIPASRASRIDPMRALRYE